MRLLHNAALALLIAIFAAGVRAQPYPSHAVRLIVPFPAGGPLDATARIVGQYLATNLGQPFIVENRPGAGGNIGAGVVAKSPADGYTVLVTLDTVLTANPALYQKISFDPQNDFLPVATLATFDLALVVHNSVPAASVRELLALAKTSDVPYASGGPGNPGHLVMELLLGSARARMTHVPYKGNAPAVADLLAGEVKAAFVALPGVLAHVKSGKLRALAVSGSRRSSALPDVPTISEAGYPEVSAEFAFIALAPAGTSRAIVHELEVALASAMGDANVAERLTQQGLIPSGAAEADTATRIKSDSDKWKKVIRSLNLQVD